MLDRKDFKKLAEILGNHLIDKNNAKLIVDIENFCVGHTDNFKRGTFEDAIQGQKERRTEQDKKTSDSKELLDDIRNADLCD